MKSVSPKTFDAVLTIAVFGIIMFFCLVKLDSPPHIPMLLGSAFAAIIAIKNGSSWKDVEHGIVQGISQALLSVVILILIGVLIGVWINTGVVPAMIFYGLKVLRPESFLPGAMLICSVISMALGSWGTAGTIGIALMGIAHILGIPAPMAAGAIISGAYMGDKVSPLSDSTNLASAVTGVDIFANVRHMFPVACSVYIIAGIAYTILGRGIDTTLSNNEEIQLLASTISESFSIGITNFLPLMLLIVFILLKTPSIPSIFGGIISAAILGVIGGHSPKAIIHSAFYGYVSESGNPVIDLLLSAGGIQSMMESIALIICAMMFGGIMENSGLMDAFMKPLISKIRRAGALITSTVLACVATNLILPEQYVAIALPGRMFLKEYDKFKVSRVELTRALGAGGATISPLIPWNTCGIFMSGVLGVQTSQYFRFAFLNCMMPAAVIMVSIFLYKNRTYNNPENP